MPLENWIKKLLPSIEQEMQDVVHQSQGPGLGKFVQMMTYHLGWDGEGAGPSVQGKRVRPLLVLLTAGAAGGHWEHALPAAAAVELLHNFSLIHDDIEDNSPARRNRPTVWHVWGVPQAINTGDGMFTLAYQALTRLQEDLQPEVVLQAMTIFSQTCLRLTQGQFLDMSYENRQNLTIDDYWPMITGKTAALLAACTHLGALTAGAPASVQNAYRQFGEYLGLAFQVQDDELGIWGDAALTGKSTASDLLTGKKSLPVLYGLSLNGPFAHRWRQGPLVPEEISDLAAQLVEEGVQAFTRDTARQLTNQALSALQQAQPQGKAGVALTQLASKLLGRKA